MDRYDRKTKFNFRDQFVGEFCFLSHVFITSASAMSSTSIMVFMLAIVSTFVRWCACAGAAQARAPRQLRSNAQIHVADTVEKHWCCDNYLIAMSRVVIQRSNRSVNNESDGTKTLHVGCKMPWVWVFCFRVCIPIMRTPKLDPAFTCNMVRSVRFSVQSAWLHSNLCGDCQELPRVWKISMLRWPIL